MLVALGSALFVLAAVESGATDSDVTRVLQGIVAGIGFLGGGAILKLTEERAIHGLTTAAGIWLTAALGAAAGLGRWGMAIICAALAWLTLELMYHFEVRPAPKTQSNASDEPAAPGV
jgi:putative Mg2+ transporter-C (MgtC) family protein